MSYKTLFGCMAVVLMLGLASAPDAQPVNSVFGPMRPQGTGAAARPLPPRLKAFLQASYRDSQATPATEVDIISAPLHTAHGELILVYATGGYVCGTGGCNLLVLKPTATGYSLIGDVQTWAPIRLLPTSHSGRPDIAVWVQGGGVRPGYAAAMRYDGETYPRDDGVYERHRLGKVSGRILISGREKGVRLFP